MSAIKDILPLSHRKRSDYIRLKLKNGTHRRKKSNTDNLPNTIIQYWHDPSKIPNDVLECINTWRELEGYRHHLFDEKSAKIFIESNLPGDHFKAFENCYHPAMQSDYFRLCYIYVLGGLYVDADDELIRSNIELANIGDRLGIQPLCFDLENSEMVSPDVFLNKKVKDENWIYYFNINPLIAQAGNLLVGQALENATKNLIEMGSTYLEIQETAGPGNLTNSIYEFLSNNNRVFKDYVSVLYAWEKTAVSKWPLSYRSDERNWRLSDKKPFDFS